MIDTIRFKIPLSERQYNLIKKKSVELKETDNTTQKINFQLIKFNELVGSFSRNISIFLDSTDFLFLEFSLPKQIMGHNVFLLSTHNLQDNLETVQNSLVKVFSDFPAVFYWEYQRIDFCYAWKMLDDLAARSTVAILQSLEFPRKKTYKYDSSVMFLGKTYSLKFYMKHEEFFTHDFKELRKLGKKQMEFAYEILQISSGVLRFEVTCRKAQLYQLFDLVSPQPLYLTDLLTDDKIISILNHFLQPLLKMKSNEVTTKQEAADKLLRFYTPTKALRLYQFMSLFYSTNSTDKMMLRDIERTARWRYLRDLKKAHVGIPIDVPGSVPLLIPSDYVVNKF